MVYSTSSEVVINKLSEIFARFGLPRFLTSDGASCFTSAEFQTYLRNLGIQHLVGAAFHPQSNGEAESAVKIIKNCIRKATVKSNNVNLSRCLNNFLFQYRNTPHSTTGESPAKLLLQRSLRCVFDLLKPNTEDVVENNQCKQVSKFKGR